MAETLYPAYKRPVEAVCMGGVANGWLISEIFWYTRRAFDFAAQCHPELGSWCDRSELVAHSLHKAGAAPYWPNGPTTTAFPVRIQSMQKLSGAPARRSHFDTSFGAAMTRCWVEDDQRRVSDWKAANMLSVRILKHSRCAL